MQMTPEDKQYTDQEIISILRGCTDKQVAFCTECPAYDLCGGDIASIERAAADRLEELTAALPNQPPKDLALHYLGKEIREVKRHLWDAIERKAPQIDIENLRRKQVALDWLTGVAIKEDDATR